MKESAPHKQQACRGFCLTREPHFPRPAFPSMNSTPAEFEMAFSAVSLAAETIGFVSQKTRR
jgi:hypothetical protein